MTSEAFWYVVRALALGALLGVPTGVFIAYVCGVL